MARKGMMVGSGKSGYYNVIPKDPTVHKMSRMGIKQPQMVQNVMAWENLPRTKPDKLKVGDKVISKFTGARGTVFRTQPNLVVKYTYKSKTYNYVTNPNFWTKGGKGKPETFAWSKDLGGKLETRYKNFAVYRVGKLPKNAKVRIQDIGRKGHSLRMAYFKNGKWHTYQYLINKGDIGSPKTKSLIAQIKSKHPNIRGGKDMPVKEIGEVLADLPSGTTVEGGESLLSKVGKTIGTGLVKVGAGTAKLVKKIGEGASEEFERYQERKRIEKEEEISHIRPELKKLVGQEKRISELKSQLKLQEEKGMDVDEERDELETEMKQLRELQEKHANINLEDLSNKELRVLSVTVPDDSLFGSGHNKYERELLRRIEKEKQVDDAIRKEKSKPIERGFWG